MEIDKIRSVIRFILSTENADAKKDVEIIISTLEEENEIRFNAALKYHNEKDNISDKSKRLQEQREKILKKYGIEPF